MRLRVVLAADTTVPVNGRGGERGLGRLTGHGGGGCGGREAVGRLDFAVAEANAGGRDADEVGSAVLGCGRCGAGLGEVTR